MLDLNSLFDESFYLNRYSDVAAAVEGGAFRSGLDHYSQFGHLEGRNPCGLFNERYYLRLYADVAAAVEKGDFTCALDHYLLFGQFEARETSPTFSESRYRRSNRDVAEAIDPVTGEHLNCLEHYLRFGKSEGRDPFDRAVVVWDEAAQQAVRNTKPGPTIASRAYGTVHTAMFDAWAAYDAVAIATQLGDTLQRPAAENTLSNKNEAISYAAYRTLTDLFPSQVSLFDEAMNQLGYDPRAVSADITEPSAIGDLSARALLDFRHRDGSNQLNGYADTTGYQPVNTPDSVSDPDRWQPLRTPLDNPSGQVQQYLTPQWGDVTPFALTAGSQFRPAPPAAFGTPEYLEQAREILDLSANLTDEQKIIAEYWEDGAGTSFPPGSWLTIGQFVSDRDTHTLDEDVKLFFALGNAVFDAGIAAWECKRFYDYVRPVTAIRLLFDGQAVQAWGGAGQGSEPIDGGDWLPYQASNFVTPPFAEHVSGHSTFSAAAAEILQRFTGSDAFGGAYTQLAGTSRFEAGTTPAADLTLSWATFSEAADEAGMSRRYGGIHFADGDMAGRALGRKVGEQVWNQAQFFIQGGV